MRDMGLNNLLNLLKDDPTKIGGAHRIQLGEEPKRARHVKCSICKMMFDSPRPKTINRNYVCDTCWGNCDGNMD